MLQGESEVSALFFSDEDWKHSVKMSARFSDVKVGIKELSFPFLVLVHDTQ